jgi:hypothetical protein
MHIIMNNELNEFIKSADDEMANFSLTVNNISCKSK